MTIPVTLYRDFPEDHRTSMDVYAVSLIKALREYFPTDVLVREFIPQLPRGLSGGAWAMRLARYGFYPFQAWQSRGKLNHVLDHGYGHLLYSLDPDRTVVTVHDLIPLVRWHGGIDGVLPGARPRLNQFSFKALQRAKRLIAISENTRQDLINYAGCKPENIVVVYYGIEAMFKPYTAEHKVDARLKWNCPDDGTKRVLISGSQFYKNLPAILKSFARLKALYGDYVELLKVGLPDPVWDQDVRNLGLLDPPRTLGAVSHTEMPELLNCVELLLFPSFYEGFGRPPLEAMACGVPVVASNAASLPEVIGDAGILCDPLDTESMAQAMYLLLTDDMMREMYIQRGLTQAKRFTWQETARKTLNVYEMIARER